MESDKKSEGTAICTESPSTPRRSQSRKEILQNSTLQGNFGWSGNFNADFEAFELPSPHNRIMEEGVPIDIAQTTYQVSCIAPEDLDKEFVAYKSCFMKACSLFSLLNIGLTAIIHVNNRKCTHITEWCPGGF